MNFILTVRKKYDMLIMQNLDYSSMIISLGA